MENLIENHLTNFISQKLNVPLKRNNQWDPSIVDNYGALFTLSLNVLILNSQYEGGARDVNNI